MDPKHCFWVCRFTQTQVGDMFIVRNAGNMVPHSSKAGTEMTILNAVGFAG